MDWIVYLALIAFAIISSQQKKKQQAAKKAAEQARRRAGAPAGSGASASAPASETFGTPEGECAPDHMHAAGTEERHVLKPSFETGHAHTEASMSRAFGAEDACPAEDKKRVIPQGEHSIPFEETPLSSRLAAFKAEKRAREAEARRKIFEAPAPEAAPKAGPAPAIDLSVEKMREAIVLSEILAKPKALRR